MAVYTETVDLKSNVSTEAKDAASQMRVLQDSILSTKTAMTKAAATSGVMSKQYLALAKQAQQFETAQKLIPKSLLDEAAAAEKAATAHKKQMEATAKAAQQTKENATAAKDSSSSIGGLNAELAEATGGLSVVAEVAGGVAVAFGAVVLAGASMAIEASEARQRMVSLFDALGEGQISGNETVAMLDKIGDAIGQTRAQLAPITQSFLTLGITGKAQLEQLTGAAAAAGAMAEGGAAKFATFFGQVDAAAQTGSKLTIPYKKLEKQLAGVGLNIGDLAKKMGTTEKALTAGLKAGTVDAGKFGAALTSAASDKGAGALAQQGRSLSSIWAKFQENIMKLFEDLKPAIDPFLEQVKQLFDILGSGTNSGKALSTGIGGFFKQVFALATKVVPYIKHFLLDLVILGLKAYIGLKPIIAFLKQLRENQAVIDAVRHAFIGIAVVVGIVVAVIAVLVGIGLVLAASIIVIIAAMIALGVAIFDMVYNAGAKLVDWIAGAPKMASDFIDGLVGGIKNGAKAVVNAVKGLADGAKNAFKGALGISSPSKVMMELGGHAADGAAQGLSDGVPDVHAASSDLAAATSKGFASGGGGPAPAAGGAGGGSGVNVTVEAGAIVIQGAGKGAEDLTEQAISLLFERIALTQGL